MIRRSMEGDSDALRAERERSLRRQMAGKISARFRAAFDGNDIPNVTYMEVYLGIGSFKPSGPGRFLARSARSAENNLIDGSRKLQRAKGSDPW